MSGGIKDYGANAAVALIGEKHGFNLPLEMRPEFRATVQKASEEADKRLNAEEAP